MRLKINHVLIGEESVYLALDGELVLGDESTGKLRKALAAYVDQEYRYVYIGMADVRKLDCAGVGTLVAAFAAGRKYGTRIVLRFLSPQAHDLLSLTKLLAVFGPESCKKKAA